MAITDNGKHDIKKLITQRAKPSNVAARIEMETRQVAEVLAGLSLCDKRTILMNFLDASKVCTVYICTGSRTGSG
jgi:hypothetical protein